MGNKLFNQYSIEKKPFLSGGYMNLWKIHKATHRDRKQDACIFVCDKKQFETMAAPNREGILNILRKEASTLQKYKHPSILGVYEPLVEDKTTMGFVSEPFEFSVTSWYDTLKPSKLEIKLMVTELCKVLCFLHEDAHVIHTNINPDVIFIDKENKVKVSGMSFALNDPPISGAEVLYNNTSCPYLNYVAPETIFENKAYYTSDTYTIGLLIFSLLEMHRGNVQYKNLINLSSNKIENYKSIYGDIDQKLGRSNFESEDMTVLYSTLNRSANARPRAKDLLESQWFNDPKLKALSFVENFAANDMNKNVEFLNQFPKIVNMFENKLVTQRFLPCILNALKNEMLINAAIPAIFAVSENPELKISFGSSVWPRLKEVLQMKSIPAASLYFLLKKVQYISDNISSTEFSNHFLNLACKAMDCNVAKIQIVVIKNLEIITKKIDSLCFKNMIYPRMIKMCLDSNSSSFKVEVLNKLKVLYSKLDQGIINDSLLTNLEKIRKSDNSSEVCIAIANIYEEISKIASLDAVGQKILPNVVAILIGGRISKSSFESLMTLVQNFLEKIKKAREKDLIDDLARASGIDLGTGDIGNMDPSKTNPNVKGPDKDDFLNTLLNQDKGGNTAFGPTSNTPIQPISIGSNNSIPSFSMNTGMSNKMQSSPSNNQSGGLDFLGDLGIPSSSSIPSSSNKPSNNLFEGLNTNISSQNKPTTHTGGMFANRNNSTSNNPFDNLSNFGQSSSFGNTSQNRGATLDSLMSDLPTSNSTQNNNAFGGFDQNKSSNLNLGDFGNTSSKTSGNIGMFDLGGFNQSSNNNSSMGGFSQSNNNNSNMGGFNQNSLDFLSPSPSTKNTNTGYNFMSSTNNTQSNTFNAFDFGNASNQRNNNMNMGNQFDFLAQSNNNNRNNFNTGSGSNNPFDFI